MSLGNLLMVEAVPSSPSGLVFNVQRFSIHDGPGIRTTVFLKGCPADCWWCHNPEARGKVPDPTGRPPNGLYEDETAECQGAARRSLAGRWMTPDEVAKEIERDEVFYRESGGGVTFSGGEPLAQPAFLLACLERARSSGFHRVVDTSGAAPQATLLEVAASSDLLLYDLKLMDEVRHKRYVGISNRRVLDNLRALDEAGARVWIRLPVIPGVNDDSANLDALVKFARGLRGHYPIYLLPYHRIGADKYRRLGEDYRLKGLEPPSRSRLSEIAARLRTEDLEVHVGPSRGARPAPAPIGKEG